MSDESTRSVIVYAFDERDNCKAAHFDATVNQFAFASVAAGKMAADNMEDYDG